MPFVDILRKVLDRPLPPRVGLIQTELDRYRKPRYLEIGVNVGVVFLHVRAARKVAVDPVNRIPRWKRLAHPNTLLRGEFVQTTSDAYFEALEPGDEFDVVFVDGLHTHEQSLRDVEQALGCVHREGVVLVHDCNPTSAAAGGPDPDASGGRGWCGEVWKTIVKLRAEREDLEVEVLDTDYGVGVIRRGRNPAPTDPGKPIAELDYSDLERRRTEFLGLRAPRRSAATRG